MPVHAAKGADDEELENTAGVLSFLTGGETDVNKLKKVSQYPELEKFLDKHCRRRHYSFQVCD